MNKLTEEQKQILSDKMDTLRCLSCSKYFPDPCEDCSFVEVFNDVVDFVSSLLQKEREAGKREGIVKAIEAFTNILNTFERVREGFNTKEIVMSKTDINKALKMLKSQSVEKGKTNENR